MPKKPRQSHIPQQITRRRKARRPGAAGTMVADDLPNADPPVFVPPGGQAPVAPLEPASQQRQHRRLESVRGVAPAPAAATRTLPGQLPTFEKAYLTRELRQISIITSLLLGVIVALTIVLR